MSETKVVLVTGGSSGIGQGIAQVFAENGYDVAITYGTNAEGGAQTKRRIEAIGRRCEVYQASMEFTDVPAKMVDQVHADFGRIDVLINNANTDQRNSVLTVTPETVEHMMNVNFASYILVTGAAARHMVHDKIEGGIIFIASTHGIRAYADDFLYGGLKAAIIRASESIALDLSPYRIRVNTIAPGATKVRESSRVMANPFEKLVPLGRMGTPRENGELAYFLCSDKGSYITGATIRVDGGLILSGHPEGWAPAHVIDPDWTKRHYEAIMKENEEDES